MKGVWTHFERLYHGAIWGGFIGIVAGGMEYLLLYRHQAFSGDLAKAYWDILTPYAVVGLLGGILSATAVSFIRGTSGRFSRDTARLFASIVTLAVFAYLVVWVTYGLGPPALTLYAIIAYWAIVTGAVAAGALLAWALRAILSRLESESGRAEPRVRVSFALILGILTALVPWVPYLYVRTTQETAPGYMTDKTQGERPNIVFILIDALRADHLPIYGYSRQTAPNLTAFARRGMTFTRMYAQAPSTRPSVATIFSSLYPTVHKVNDNYDFLAESVTVLPEMLRTAGYKTFGVSANANVSPTFGYSQGFDEFRVWKTESAFRLTMMGRLAEDALGPSRLSRILREQGEIVPQAEAITDITLKWVSQSGKEPFFLYVHYIDPHDPYSPPAPYDKAFDYRSDPPIRAGGIDPLTLLSNGQDRERIGRILDQYDGEILYADREVGRLLKELENLGVLENALVIVTADHGEEFFEHGNDSHGRSTYEEVLRVPFLLYWRDNVPVGARYDGMVRLIDVMPTLLTLLGITPPDEIQGSSFAAQLVRPTGPESNQKLFAQVVQDTFALEMVRDSRYKLIRHLRGPRRGLEELYDLERDPLERTNLAKKARTEAAVLGRELEAFNTTISEAAGRIRAEQVQTLDRDTERALRSLGYIK
ncbi:sulfatase [Candidatus Methylomirabilis sp.]|uniref:sulfatase n=1 Tax=Candidatus Methylomirabilis sp. TaxID=2032687 RepID=UPI003075F42E